jgi:hypothetical protein
MATARRTSGWLYSYRSRTQNSKSPARADGLIHRLSWAGDRKHPAQPVNKPGEPIQGGFGVPTGWLPDGLRVASGWLRGQPGTLFRPFQRKQRRTRFCGAGGSSARTGAAGSRRHPVSSTHRAPCNMRFSSSRFRPLYAVAYVQCKVPSRHKCQPAPGLHLKQARLG